MPKVTIDGLEIEVPKGATILEACEQAKVRIPFFCYHPALSIAGNCRMCLVEVEKMPKLAIACNTTVMDGMVVRTTTDKVKKAQQGVLEIMLANHPLDCPICDQAGECGLQDRYMEFSGQVSRFREPKIEKPKRKAFSDLIMYDGERCILCSRCVRFCDEITKDKELGIFERGAHSVVDTFGDGKLTSGYQLCLADICPVGALTSRDFRFKCRAWYLTATPSVCTKCARGCSILVDSKDGAVQRYRPRKNPDVNAFWMCDEGRLTYKEIAENRVTEPLVRDASGKLVPVSWDEAVALVVKKFKAAQGSVGLVASAFETNEANFALKKLAEAMGASLGTTPADVAMGKGDDLLKLADKTPNRTGLSMLGLSGDVSAAKALFVMGSDLAPEAAAKLDFLVVATPFLTPLAEKANVVLPTAHAAEQFGSYTNFQKIVQKTERGVAAPGGALPAYQAISKIGEGLGAKIPVCPAALFKAITAEAEAFSDLTWAMLDPCGGPCKE